MEKLNNIIGNNLSKNVLTGVFGASAGVALGSIGMIVADGIENGTFFLSQSEIISQALDTTEQGLGSMIGLIAGGIGVGLSASALDGYGEKDPQAQDPRLTKTFAGSFILGAVAGVVLGNAEINLPDLPEPSACAGAKLIQSEDRESVTLKLPAGCTLKP